MPKSLYVSENLYIQISITNIVKYYLMRLESPFEITRFPLFQNVNRNLFCLKYERLVLVKYC